MSVTAVEYREELATGSTRPLVLLCESPTGEAQDYVVKLRSSSKTGPFGLASEWLCSGLASSLNLSIPSPAVVEIVPEFANSVPNDAIRARLLENLGPNFGSVFWSGGYSTWPRGRPLSRQLRPVAADILCFDVFIQNLDRRPEKPNVLWRGEEIAVVDHELAFPFPFLVGCNEPWTDPFVAGIRQHVFFSSLKGNLDSLDRFQGAVESITDRDLGSLFQDLPGEWCLDGKVDQVREYLPRRRDNAESWLDSVRRELA